MTDSALKKARSESRSLASIMETFRKNPQRSERAPKNRHLNQLTIKLRENLQKSDG